MPRGRANGRARSFGLAFTLPDDLKALYQSFGIDLPKNTGRDAWELCAALRRAKSLG